MDETDADITGLEKGSSRGMIVSVIISKEVLAEVLHSIVR